MGFCRERCLIVEDTFMSCTRNHGNAVHVPSFCVAKSWNPVQNIVNDNALPHLMSFLEAFILPSRDVRAATRMHRKRGWMENETTDSVSERCPVCDGTQLLIRDPCPLCV